MKNAKYLIAIAAFVTLAFVGFSAFTSTSGNVAVEGKPVANMKVYLVHYAALSVAQVSPGISKVFLTQAEADAWVQAAVENDANYPSSSTYTYYVVASDINVAKKSKVYVDLKGGAGW